MPVSVLCTVFGFFTLDSGSKNIHKFQRIYCLIIVLLLFILDTTNFCLKLFYVRVKFVSFIILISDAVTSVILTYYRVKFILEENITNNILNSLDYVDKCLNSVGVKVSPMKDSTIYYAYITITLSNAFYISYLFQRNVLSGNGEPQLTNVYTNTFSFYAVAISGSSYLASQLYLNVILYILHRKLMVFRYIIDDSNLLKNAAWSACSNVACRRRSITEQHQLFNTYFLTYTALTEAYYNIKKFYVNVFRLYLLILIFTTSIYLTYSTFQTNHIHLVFFIINMLGLQTIPLQLSVRITSEFHNIQRLIYNINQ